MQSVNPSPEKSPQGLAALGPLIPLTPGSKKTDLKGWPTASREELAAAMKARPGANIGLRGDDVTVFDVDSEGAQVLVDRLEKEGKLPPTVTFTTWRGRRKLIFRKSDDLPKTVVIKDKENDIALELRTGPGHYDVMPGSTVEGKPYTWVPGHSPEEIELAELPLETLKELLVLAGQNGNDQGVSREKTNWGDLLLKEMADGQGRDNSAAQLAGHYLAKGLPEDEVLALLRIWNSKHKDPLPEKDIIRVVKSIAKAEARSKAEQPQGLIWPSWVMSGAAGNFARSFSQYIESPPPFLYMSYLTSLGHMICEKVSLLSAMEPPPRLYTVILGESADDRKSTAIKLVIDFFIKTIDDLDGFNILRGAGSAEGVARAFNPNPKLDGDKPPLSRLLLLLDELKALIQKMKMDTSVLLTAINSLFEDDHYHSLTKHHRIELDNANLSILAASTLDTYQSMFTATFMDIGFVNRFFIVIGGGKRKFSIPEPIPGDLKIKLRNELGNVLSFAESLSNGVNYAMPLTPEARKIFDEWYHTLEHSVFAKRLDTYGHRLMPLLAINEMKSEVDEDIAKKVVALLDYQLAARKLADPLDADNAVAKMEQNIRRRLSVSRMRGRDLKRACHYERAGLWVFDQAIKNLISAKEVEFDKKSKFYQAVDHG